MPPYTQPTVQNFKDQFFRDFPYGGTSGDLTTIQDQDIVNAIAQMADFINQNLFTSQGDYQSAALQLSAHYLVLNIRASSQGIAGKFPWLTSSKGVGSVSEGFSIPEELLKNPVYSILASTRYGVNFFMTVYPRLAGQMFATYARTNP